MDLCQSIGVGIIYLANPPSLSTMLTRRVFLLLEVFMEYTKPALTHEQRSTAYRALISSARARISSFSGMSCMP